ncbi:flagellar protein FlaG [Salipaludibacillus sp. LMS25]|jgi:flagellar protein FlaG|uniref:flagellar protein FlaG n=1 Tax=Salipaludibacillus sp. LMS25 TaxID=2924031 RepID=UPI0020D15454|nr:flagellar protein FlaG [Salipaludibacillus sp. LMS25]UTR16061.1 flagellar protein FlaG [Salipaludibacillus sp. LMS25]
MEVKSNQSVASDFIQRTKEFYPPESTTQGSKQVSAANHVEEAQQIQKEASRDDVVKQIDTLNDLVNHTFTNLKFQLHDDLDRYYVQVVDRQTDEVVREVPPEQFLDMISSMLEYAGLIIDKKI